MLRTALAGLVAAALVPSGVMGQQLPAGWSLLPFTQAIMLAVDFVDSKTGFIAGRLKRSANESAHGSSARV
jgi:hypothetical protein